MRGKCALRVIIIVVRSNRYCILVGEEPFDDYPEITYDGLYDLPSNVITIWICSQQFLNLTEWTKSPIIRILLQ